MKKEELLALFDREQRIEVQIPDFVHESDGRVIRDRGLRENAGFICYSDLDETCADAEIERQIDYFSTLNMRFEWKVYDHDRPADLRQRLAAHGFVIEEPEALVVLDTEDAPDFYETLALPENLVRVCDAQGVEGVVQMEEEVWQGPRDWLRARLTHNLNSIPDLLSIFAIVDGGRTVAAAWVYYHPPSHFASLWGGSTLPAYRKRGYYSALLAARVREARRRGYRFLTVDASPMSRPILEKLGFQFLGFSTPCQWTPAGSEGG